MELYFKRYEFSNFRHFLYFYEFKLIYFELKSLNMYRYISHADVAGNVWVCVHVCASVDARVRACEERESFLFRITLSLDDSLILYMRYFLSFLSCGTLFFLF